MAALEEYRRALERLAAGSKPPGGRCLCDDGRFRKAARLAEAVDGVLEPAEGEGVREPIPFPPASLGLPR